MTTTYGVQLGSLRSAAAVHQLHRHRPVSQRGRRRTWTGSSAGIPQGWRNTTYWVAFDPRAWARLGRAQRHARPAAAEDVATNGSRRTIRAVSASRPTAGARGRVNGGMAESAMTHVLLDPAQPARAGGRSTPRRSAAASTRPTDGGHDLDSSATRAWRQQPSPRGGSRRRRAARCTSWWRGAASAGASATRDDGALLPVHGRRRALDAADAAAGTNGPNALSVEPGDPRRLYLAAWGVTPGRRHRRRYLPLHRRRPHWRATSTASQHVYDVTVDPRDRHVLRLRFRSGCLALRRSRRALASPARLRLQVGSPSVVPDPASPDRVYITTFGGSVWYGPAVSQTSAAEP